MALLAVGAAGALASGLALGPAAAAAVALTAAACALVALAFTRARYRALARLAAQIDDVLHGARDVSFERMREGELAILASELDKMRSRLTLANEDLEREKNALADALADISHQLKTPLTSLALMTALVRRELAAEGGRDGQLARLRTMERLEGRVEWLVASLLKLARIDAGVVSFARARVDAGELVERAAEPLAVAFDLADVTLKRDVEAGAGFEGDLSWTAEALENVLKNCLEHTPAGGCVRVRAWQDALAFRVRVEDTGGGIAPEDLPHVFERFYRGGAAGATGAGTAASEVDPGGVGIGLALAQSLVTAQGGQIRAGNAPDGGARFDIAFFSAVV
nr:HAMP domain-containing sensor histidine kinase [Olsenella profusa]